MCTILYYCVVRISIFEYRSSALSHLTDIGSVNRQIMIETGTVL